MDVAKENTRSVGEREEAPHRRLKKEQAISGFSLNQQEAAFLCGHQGSYKFCAVGKNAVTLPTKPVCSYSSRLLRFGFQLATVGLQFGS